MTVFASLPCGNFPTRPRPRGGRASLLRTHTARLESSSARERESPHTNGAEPHALQESRRTRVFLLRDVSPRRREARDLLGSGRRRRQSATRPHRRCGRARGGRRGGCRRRHGQRRRCQHGFSSGACPESPERVDRDPRAVSPRRPVARLKRPQCDARRRSAAPARARGQPPALAVPVAQRTPRPARESRGVSPRRPRVPVSFVPVPAADVPASPCVPTDRTDTTEGFPRALPREPGALGGRVAGRDGRVCDRARAHAPRPERARAHVRGVRLEAARASSRRSRRPSRPCRRRRSKKLRRPMDPRPPARQKPATRARLVPRLSTGRVPRAALPPSARPPRLPRPRWTRTWRRRRRSTRMTVWRSSRRRWRRSSRRAAGTIPTSSARWPPRRACLPTTSSPSARWTPGKKPRRFVRKRRRRTP